MSNRIRIVSSSTSASDTLMSPATTSPLSRTRSSTSTSPVDRPCPSVSDVGIGPLFYEVSRALAYLTVKDEGRDYLSNGNARSSWTLSGNSVWNEHRLHRSPTGHCARTYKIP